MSARRLTLATLCALCAPIWALALASTPAQAAATHHLISKITEIPATGPKGESVPMPGPIYEPFSETVNEGKLWVAEQAPESRWRVDEFNAATGAFIAQLPQQASIAYLQNGVAVGHSTGETELYVGADSYPEGSPEGSVAVFGPASELQNVFHGTDTPSGHFGCFSCEANGDVAVDESASIADWAKGDIYVAATRERVVDVFEPSAHGGEKYAGAQLTGISPSEPFRSPEGVAVDQANGDVIVLDARRTVDIFRPTLFGQYEFVRRITGTPAGPFLEGSGGNQIAVGGGEGDGDIYITAAAEDNSPQVVDQFSSEGVYMGQLTGPTSSEPFPGVTGVAVDQESHEVYVGVTSAIDIFGANLTIPDVAPVSPTAVKPDGHGRIDATLNGTVNPDKAGSATCEFDWGTSSSLGEEVACSPARIEEGSSPVPVSANLTGLEPDTAYYYKLQATNANGTNTGEALGEVEFTTPGPGLRAEAVSAVRAESVTFEAKLGPNSAPTTYYFQYGTSTAYGADAPVLAGGAGATAGAGAGDLEVTQHAQGLQAGSLYHYRLVAVSELAPGEFETFFGPDQTFTTQPKGVAFQLPDGRTWEMVSPPFKEGANMGSLSISGPVQASVGGGAFVDYTSPQPIELEPAGTDTANEIFFGRTGAGWVSKVIVPPHAKAIGVGVGQGTEYRVFSEDLSRAVMQPWGGFVALSPEASESTAYLHTDYLNGDPGQICVSGCYQPLVMAGNVPPGTAFGEERANGECAAYGVSRCGPQFVAGTPDLRHIVVESQVGLTETPEDTGGEYEWSDGKLAPIAILPAVETNEKGGSRGENGEVAGSRHAISNDGSRVIWSGSATTSPGETHLYLRDISVGETVRLDVPQAGAPGPEGLIPTYMTASSDGSRVFFLDRGLTADSTPHSQDLYEYDLNAPLGSRLKDLSVDHNEGEPANVAMVDGASEDGSYVYFVAVGALTPDAPKHCASSGGRACNLYVSHDGQVTFIASLSGEDPDSSSELTGLDVRVSPDGHWLAFMSNVDLTGYDTTDAFSRRPDEEVYLYDALLNKLVCASCNPTGARPVGVRAEGGGEQLALEPSGLFGNTWVASSVPGWTPLETGETRYQSRYLSDAGRLFFDSNDALVPQDVNGTEDVYEYEPAGVGDCGTGSVTYSGKSGGCVNMVSSGTSNEESAFLDASESGGDVFFLTKARLVPQDFDNALDVYDAHECTASSPCVAPSPAAPPPCDNADSCKPAQSLQPTVFGAGPSETFSGAGNITPATPAVVKPRALTRAQKLARALLACSREHGRRRRAACLRRARKQYGGASGAARGARKAGRDQSAGARR